MKKLLKLLPLIMALMLSLTACSSDEGTTTTVENEVPTHLDAAVELFPTVLEPSTNWESWYLTRFAVGETLVTYDDEGAFAPWLAESWSVAEDGLTWTFNLRDDVYFSNGEQMKASDVKESIERLYYLEDPANGGTGNPQGYFTFTEIVAYDDENYVTITTADPTPDMPGCMAYPWTMIIDVDASEERNVNTEGPIATGAYAVESFVQDSNLQLVKNEYYWAVDVAFETVNVMKIADATTRAMALKDGSVQVAVNVAAGDLALFGDGSEYDVNIVAGTRTGYNHFNLLGELGNETVRQAVLMAIDGESIADISTNGAFTYGISPIPPTVDYGYDELTNSYTYNPDEAIRILDEAGIVDTNGDGYRELDGENIDLVYICTSARYSDILAQAKAICLEQIGIKCTVEVLSSITDRMNSRDFDICSSNEVVTPTGDPTNYLRHWYTDTYDNYASYDNPEFDATFEALMVEFDTDLRKDYIVELQQMILDDAAVDTSGYFNYNICTVAGITGANPNPNDFYWITSEMRYE